MALDTTDLTFRELGSATCLTQTHFLAFYFTSITCHKAGFAQRLAKALIIGDQGTGDAMTDCTGLA